MAYSDHFYLADDFIAHLDKALIDEKDPFVQSRYIGFLAVTAVTVYELAIKEVFIDFADKKHRVLGSITRRYFHRLNGQIKKKRLLNDHIIQFGSKYVEKFKKNLKKRENKILRADGVSVDASYGNIITWRNQFAHEGVIPSTPTYDEVKKAYSYGKILIDCLAKTMTR